MLLYSNKSVIRQLCQLNGSVVFGDARQICIGLVLAAATVFLQYLVEVDSQYAPDIPNNYGLAALGVLTSFAIVFRTNLAWSRYWEALTQVNFMYSKFGDAFLQIAVFCRTSYKAAEKQEGEEAAAKARRLQVIFSNVVKYFSLLSAMAADRIYHGDTQRMDMRLEMGKWRDQVVRRRDLAACEDITNSKRLPELRVGTGHHQQGIWREKSGLPDGTDWQHTYFVNELPTDEEQEALFVSEDRVNVCVTWILESLAMASKDLITPPPIQSRMYQEISNGCLGFTNCMKISDTPFPFCYSQLVSIILIVFCAFVPVFVTAFTHSYFAGPALTFVIVHSIVCLNELAKILENPFGHDAEDICLEDFHSRFLHVMEGTREALDVQHNAMFRGDSFEPKESRRSRSPKQTVYGQPGEIAELTAGSQLAAMPQGAPGGLSVTGVWCELPQQSLQQGTEREQDGVLQDPRSGRIGPAQHGILPTSGNTSRLSGVGCWRGLISPDWQAGQSKEPAFKNAGDGSSKPACATSVSQKDEPRDSATGLNTSTTAQGGRDVEQGMDVTARSLPEQRGNVLA